MKIKKRYFLQKKKVKELKNELKDYSELIPEKSKVELIEIEHDKVILVDNTPKIILITNTPYPTLKGIIESNYTRNYVTIDMGAVKFMMNGADVMSPGIVDADPNVKKDDVVVIIDETHNKPLAIGIALISAEEMVENDKGKAVNTMHYVGDKIWELNI